MRSTLDIEVFKQGKWADKAYNFFGDYLSAKYKCRVLKLPINAEFNCPNRDGSINSDGCIFCCDSGSASPTTYGSTDIRKQMMQARKNFKRSDAFTRYIAYFQAYTNTYAPIEKLKQCYDAATQPDDIIGLMIGTRPDCINEEILRLISSYQRDEFELWVEYGIQSMHDKSLKFLNRGHSHKTSRDTILLTKKYSIPICVHIIIGVPGESWEDIMATAIEISSLPVSGVKIHHLHVIKDTPLETYYKQKRFTPLSMKEYVSTLCDFIERLRPDIIIHRVMGDRNENSLIAPRWGMHKGTVLKAIDDEFSSRGTFQGILYK